MIFHISKRRDNIELLTSSWSPQELQIEKLICAGTDPADQVLSEAIFGEPLFKVRRQCSTPNGKRLDILALDRRGNSVIIELKRDQGYLGMDTQALQYLAEISPLKGQSFLERCEGPAGTEKALESFFDSEVRVEDLNRRQRIILLARGFDRSLFSMGKWLADLDVPVRCIQYNPFEVKKDRFLAFSIVFDQGWMRQYPLDFKKENGRPPAIFWHNIGNNDQQWWKHLLESSEIPAGFENSPGDEGERILRRYIKGDRIIGYANKYGALGWAKVEDLDYRLIGPDMQDARFGYHRHRLKVVWQERAKIIQDGIRPAEFEAKFNLVHPRRTSNRIKDENAGNTLIECLASSFGSG